MARFAFWVIFVLSLSNLLGLLVTYFGKLNDPTFQLAVYPVVFAACALLVFAFTKGRQTSTILVAAWVFWLIYFLGGFLGEYQHTGVDLWNVLRITIKPWITIIGLPWLALRAISEEKAPRLLRATVVITALGAILGILQAIIPGFFAELTEAGRAAGLWLNANDYGVMCAMVLFISIMCPFRRGRNWPFRLLLIAGVAASFSRSAILVLAIGWIVYGVSAKRFGTLFKSLFAVVVVWAVVLAGLRTIDALSPARAERIKLMRAFLEGNLEEAASATRTEAWKQAFLAIESKGGLVLGLGHGTMAVIVDAGNVSISPHNYFLYVWGDAGLLGLLGLLAFQCVLVQQAFKCPRRETRAAMLSIAAILTVMHLFSNSMFGMPFYGAILACVVVTASYSRSQGASRPDALRARLYPPPRPRWV